MNEFAVNVKNEYLLAKANKIKKNQKKEGITNTESFPRKEKSNLYFEKLLKCRKISEPIWGSVFLVVVVVVGSI